MKIAVFSAHQFEMPYLTKAFASDHELVFIKDELNEHTIHQAVACHAVSLFTSDKANAAVLSKLSQMGIKYIALRSVGYDHVDLSSAKKLQIPVANVPAYSPYSVAEHAVTLLMALNRKLLLSQELIHTNNFILDGLTGFDVHGKTVGIVGLGKIGEAFATIMNGFGCKIVCYDPLPKHELGNKWNIQFVDLKTLCIQSDIISIHCPLNESTKHLFNKALFSIMKKGVYLINTSRGAIINTQDLIVALEEGIVGAAGLDVYEFEKGLFFHDYRGKELNDPVFSKLRTFKNVLITGHQAFLTETALKNIADTTAYNLDCFDKGISCPNSL
jgi:D-lactate dehydrogenase